MDNNLRWTPPITDRTNLDVLMAKSAIEDAIRLKRDPITPEPRKWIGCLNYYDLNRIEGNILYLYIQLEKKDIKIKLTNPKIDWTQENLLTDIDVKRIISNIKIITDFLNIEINLPESMTHFEEINQIEIALLRIYEFQKGMERVVRLSGTFHAGQEGILPVSLLSNLKSEEEKMKKEEEEKINGKISKKFSRRQDSGW